MFNCKHVSAGQASSYYKLDDYYSEKNHVPAKVAGTAAEKLGLFGEFNSEKFNNALLGRFDFVGEPLAGKCDPSQKRAGFDCVFSAPKSVSLEALLHGKDEIVEAHNKAVQVAMLEIERMIKARITKDGKTMAVDADCAYFSFLHETARNISGELPDPDLHTHNVVLKAVIVRDKYGKEEIYAIDTREIFTPRAQHYLDAIYKQNLAEAVRKLGHEIVQTKDGFELANYSKEMLNEFSKRRNEVDMNLEKMGLTRESSSVAQRDKANLKNRNSKKTFTRREMKEAWQSTFDKVNQKESATARHIPDSKKSNNESSPLADEIVKASIAHFQTREAYVPNRYTIAEFAIRFGEFRVSIEDIHAAIDRQIEAGELVMGRNGKAMVFRQAIEDEKKLKSLFQSGLKAVESAASIEEARAGMQQMESAMTSRLIAKKESVLGRPLYENEKAMLQVKLTEKQAKMVEKIATSQDRFSVIVGDAGTGKSTGMEAAQIILKGKGFKVLGLAPSAAAVNALKESGLATKTVQHAFHNPKYWDEVDEHTVIVMDEAGLVDIRTSNFIQERITEKGARLAIVGDHKQFGSVDRGTAMQQLCTEAEKSGEW